MLSNIKKNAPDQYEGLLRIAALTDKSVKTRHQARL